MPWRKADPPTVNLIRCCGCGKPGGTLVQGLISGVYTHAHFQCRLRAARMIAQREEKRDADR